MADSNHDDHEHGTCTEAITSLYEYLDGELTTERRADIQQHLDDCSPCFEAFDFEAELRIVVAQKCREQVPDSLKERVTAALEDAGEPAEG